MSHLYDIIRNPKYRIGKPFPFKAWYEFFSKHIPLLQSGGGNNTITEAPNMDSSVDKDGMAAMESDVVSPETGGKRDKNDPQKRSVGTKSAKRIKHMKAGKESLESSASKMVVSVSTFNEVYKAEQERKAQIKERQIVLEKQQLEWKISESLISKDPPRHTGGARAHSSGNDF